MADYTPVYVPGKVFTSTASAAVVGGALLSVSGSGTVATAAGSATVPPTVVGVAAQDAPVNGRVTVFGRGIIHESVANGTVTAGDLVTGTLSGDTAGAQVKTLAVVTTPTPADVTNSRVVLGIALTTASNPAKVRWMEI